MHSETKLFTTLFGLLLWDLIHSPPPTKSCPVCAAGVAAPTEASAGAEACPCVFVHPFQRSPLDLMYPSFLGRRRHAVELRLRWLAAAGSEAITHEITDAYHVSAERNDDECNFGFLSVELVPHQGDSRVEFASS